MIMGLDRVVGSFPTKCWEICDVIAVPLHSSGVLFELMHLRLINAIIGCIQMSKNFYSINIIYAFSLIGG